MKTIDDLITKIDELLEAIRTGGRSTNAGDTTDDSGDKPRRRTIPAVDMSGITKFGGDLTDLFKNIGEAGVGVKAVFNSVAGDKDAIMSVFKSIAGTGTMGKAVTLATNEIADTRKTTRAGGDTDTFKQGQYQKTNQISYDDIIKAMRDTGTGGSSFGGLIGERLENVNKTLVKLNQNAGTEGRYRGGSADPETLAKALVISQQRSTGNLGDAGDQDRAVINAQKLSDEIDKTAKLTGKTRDMVADELAARMKNNQFMLDQFGTNEEARQSYIRSQAAMAKHGTAVQDLSNDFLKFGTATEKTQGTLVALGPAGMKLRDAMLSLKNATNEKERQEAEIKVREASTAINERGRDPRMARMAAMADAFPELKALQGAKQQYEQNEAQASYNFQRNKGLSPEAATRELDEQVKRQQSGKDAQGRPLTGGQALYGLNAEANRAAAVGAGVLFGKLNTELERAIPAFSKISADLEKVSPPFKPSPTPIGKTSNSEADRTPIKETRPGGTALGTLGVTGSTFEPKDIFSLIHQGERVLNPKENKDLTNLYEMIGNLKAKGDTEKDKGVPEIETATASVEPEETASDNITLKDVHESLERLNSTMQIMAEHTADMKDSNRTTADMSQKMTGNRLAV
jgi:hypothetical protein